MDNFNFRQNSNIFQQKTTRSNIQTQEATEYNRATEYYPEMMNFEIEDKKDVSFDAINQTQFQQDFSYLEPNREKNEEINNQKINFDKNTQKNGLNVENLINILKNSSSNDLLSTILASSAIKPQNPLLNDALSKIVSQKKEKASKSEHIFSNDSYEEM